MPRTVAGGSGGTSGLRVATEPGVPQHPRLLPQRRLFVTARQNPVKDRMDILRHVGHGLGLWRQKVTYSRLLD